MHTHQADCVSARRQPPLRPELHSTTMSQGLPSVDTQSHQGEHVRGETDRRTGEWLCRPNWLTDPWTPATPCKRWKDSYFLSLYPLHCDGPWSASSSNLLLFSPLNHRSRLFQIVRLSLRLALFSLYNLSSFSLSLSLSVFSVHQPNGSILSGMGSGQKLLKV